MSNQPPVSDSVVNRLLEMLKEEQRKNGELVELILEMARKELSKSERVEIIKTVGEQNFIRGVGKKPELHETFFDKSDVKVEASTEDLSEKRTVSEKGIDKNKLSKLRALIKG